MHGFFIYCGKTESGKKCTRWYAVLKLIETLTHHKNCKLFIDNWFCSLALCLQLRQMEFLTIATMRSGRKKSCPLPCEKDLKKRGKRAHAYRTDVDSVSGYKCVLIILILHLLVPSRGEEKKRNWSKLPFNRRRI